MVVVGVLTEVKSNGGLAAAVKGAARRGSTEVDSLAEVALSRRRRPEDPELHAIARYVPPNKPLQRTQSPQGNWSNINEPLVRRPRR